MCRLNKRRQEKEAGDLLGILYFLRHLRMSAFRLPRSCLTSVWWGRGDYKERGGKAWYPLAHGIKSPLNFLLFFPLNFHAPKYKESKPTYSWIPAGRMGPAPSPSPGVIIKGSLDFQLEVNQLGTGSGPASMRMKVLLLVFTQIFWILRIII